MTAKRSKQDQYGFDADPYEQFDEGGVARADVPAAAPRAATRTPFAPTKSIGRVRLLTKDDEVRLAKRVEMNDMAAKRSAHRGEPATGGLDRQALHGTRPHAARPDPGGQPRPHPRSGEVRLAPRLQVLHIRDVVDPQAITRALADQSRTIRIPVHMVERMNKVARVRRSLLRDRPRADTRGDRRPPRRHRRETGGGHPQAGAGAGVPREPRRR